MRNKRKKQGATAEAKHQERADWWLNTIGQAFDQGDKSLLDHPAIKKAVEAIEEKLSRTKKCWSSDDLPDHYAHLSICSMPVRCCAAFRTRNRGPKPKCMATGTAMPRTASGRSAPAHRQLNSPLQLETLDRNTAYSLRPERQRREEFRERLIPRSSAVGKDIIPERISKRFLILQAFRRCGNTGRKRGAEFARSRRKSDDGIIGDSDAESPDTRAHSAS